MEGKGIGTIRGGISYAKKERDIYSVHSPQKLPPMTGHEFGLLSFETEEELDLDKKLLRKFNKSRCANGIKSSLKYLCIFLFTPFYFLFYCIPKSIWDNALYPIVQAFINFFKPPVSFVIRTYHRFRNYLQRKKEQILKKWHAIVNAIKNAVLRVVLPIRNWFTATWLKVKSIVLKVLHRIFDPIIDLLTRIKNSVARRLQSIKKYVDGKIHAIALNIQKAGNTVLNLIGSKTNRMTRSMYNGLLSGGLFLNRIFKYILACLQIIPKYFGDLAKELAHELREWFSFR